MAAVTASSLMSESDARCSGSSAFSSLGCSSASAAMVSSASATRARMRRAISELGRGSSDAMRRASMMAGSSIDGRRL